MDDWRRRSIAGGPSPATPGEDIPNALHLDFFYRPIAFPSNGAGGTRKLESAIMSPTDEAFFLSAADGDTRITVAPPATEVPPLQPPQYQPIGTAATGGGGSRRQRSWRPHGSGGRASCPSSSQLPPLPEHAAVSFVNNEADEDEEAVMAPGRSDDEDEEEVMLYAHNDDHDEEAMSSGRSEEDDEALSSGRSEEDDEAMSSERGEEDDEGTSSGRGEEDDEGTTSGRGEEDDEATSSVRGEEDDEDEEQNEEELPTESEEEEEEEPKVPDKCMDCGSTEALVMLLPCRHSCYCRLCFRNSRWRSGPARLHCPVCGRKYERGHPQSGRLGPTKSR